jgi:hypothetical protein
MSKKNSRLFTLAFATAAAAIAPITAVASVADGPCGALRPVHVAAEVIQDEIFHAKIDGDIAGHCDKLNQAAKVLYDKKKTKEIEDWAANADVGYHGTGFGRMTKDISSKVRLICGEHGDVAKGGKLGDNSYNFASVDLKEHFDALWKDVNDADRLDKNEWPVFHAACRSYAEKERAARAPKLEDLRTALRKSDLAKAAAEGAHPSAKVSDRKLSGRTIAPVAFAPAKDPALEAELKAEGSGAGSANGSGAGSGSGSGSGSATK